MKSLGKIYIVWRKGKGSRRRPIGVLKRSAKGLSFKYISNTVEEAQKEGFTPFVDFPDTTKTYTENVIDVFGQRLIKSERSDLQKYLDFWLISPQYIDEKFYMLAHTQGMLSTDNIEFLADFNPRKDLSFVSEISGLSYSKHSSDCVEIGDQLSWSKESVNEYDPFAIAVYKEKLKLGYVKIIHNKVFHKPGGDKLKIWIKSIERNGHLNRVFIKISF